jgi:sensor c-di-GMP phosphodiesterase-like protein
VQNIMLREQGYPVAQGFLFARPLAPQDLERWLVARMAPAQASADQPVHGEESA